MYNMCKCCQSCFETIYWHCIEKRFCYDENIALFEEPKEYHPEKNNNAFENMAFYDNVALIAGRPIFTIEPLPERSKPIEKQPRAMKTLKWWEDIEKQNKENEIKQTHSITTIQEETENNLELDLSDRPPGIPTTIQEEAETNSVDTVDIASVVEKAEPTKVEKPEAKIGEAPMSNSSEEEKPNKKEAKTTLEINPPVNLRKKLLTQRRMSKSLSLIIDPTELPLIRQSTMPKFYLDTPEGNQTDSTIAATPSIALASPIVPSNHSFHFDLKSVVQMEKEKAQSFRADSRLANARKRIKPLNIKRQTSMINLSPTKFSQL